MIFKEDWMDAKKRLEALWNNEIIDRCCVSVIAPKNGCRHEEEAMPEKEADLFKYYTDGEWVLERNLKKFEKTYFGGEGFPCIWPNFGTAGHAKYFKGARYKFAKDTVWYEPFIKDWDSDKLEFDPDGILKLEKETMRFLAKEGENKFFVSVPDNCGIIDALTHLRGTDNLLMDLLDYPEEVKASTQTIRKVLQAASEEIFEIIKHNNENGSAHGWMLTWSKGRHLQLQVDFSVMISPKMFEEFALSEIETMADWLDNSIYHLDGREQIIHLDMILSVKKLNMIQWTPVAGQPDTSEFIPVLQRIQKAGKGLVLFPKKREIEKLMTELSSKGLYMIVNDAESEDEAREIVKKVAHLTKR